MGGTEREQKEQLARGGSASVEQLDEFARDPDPQVRAAVAQNASERVLRTLGSDPRAEVRAVVAANPHTPRDVLFGLVTDRSSLVRFWLTVHKDRELLRLLAEDPDELTASAAKSALDGQRLYRRLLDAPSEWLAKRAHRMIKDLTEDAGA